MITAIMVPTFKPQKPQKPKKPKQPKKPEKPITQRAWNTTGPGSDHGNEAVFILIILLLTSD